MGNTCEMSGPPLTLAGAQGLQAGLVAQGVLSGLHDQSQTAERVEENSSRPQYSARVNYALRTC